MSSTATIRVPVETRDLLADIARWKNQSLSSYLADLTWSAWEQLLAESAREESRLFERDPVARAEFDLLEEAWDDLD